MLFLFHVKFGIIINTVIFSLVLLNFVFFVLGIFIIKLYKGLLNTVGNKFCYAIVNHLI